MSGNHFYESLAIELGHYNISTTAHSLETLGWEMMSSEASVPHFFIHALAKAIYGHMAELETAVNQLSDDLTRGLSELDTRDPKDVLLEAWEKRLSFLEEDRELANNNLAMENKNLKKTVKWLAENALLTIRPSTVPVFVLEVINADN